MSDIKLSPKYGVNPTIPVCFWCGNEKSEVAIMGRVGDSRKHEDFAMPMYAVIDYEPCEECAKAMKLGVTLIEATQAPNESTSIEIQDNVYPTGRWAIVKKDAAHRIFPNMDEDINKAFVETEAYKMIFGDM